MQRVKHKLRVCDRTLAKNVTGHVKVIVFNSCFVH